jgi:hypothetical protein
VIARKVDLGVVVDRTGEDGMGGRDLTEPLGKRQVLVPADVLTSEEDHVMLVQRSANSGNLLVACVGDFETVDLRANSAGQRLDADLVIGDVRHRRPF